MNADGTHTWREFATEARQRLEQAGFERPDIDAHRIVERASGFEGSSYHQGLSELATERGVIHFDAMMARRLAGEPLQYVVGSWGFRYLDLLVDQRALIPRPETEVIAQAAIDILLERTADVANHPVVAADLGTGTGAIGLSLAQEVVDAQVILTDRSPDALAVARANLAGLGRAATRVQICEGSWFEALPRTYEASLDLIASNPPYVADQYELPDEVARWEPAEALRAGPDGMNDLKTIVSDAGRWLKPGGALVLEMDPAQVSPTRQLAAEAGFVNSTVVVDFTGRDRGVVCQWRG